MNTMNATRPHSFGLFDNAFRDGVRGTAEALFPINTVGAPDYESTNLVQRTQDYVRGLPPTQRPLVALMFIGIELGAPFIAGGLRRFSRQSPERRVLAVHRWRTSWLFPLRMLGDAVKATLGMIYLSHPTLLRHIGEYKPFANPGDAFDVDIRSPDGEAQG